MMARALLEHFGPSTFQGTSSSASRFSTFSREDVTICDEMLEMEWGPLVDRTRFRPRHRFYGFFTAREGMRLKVSDQCRVLMLSMDTVDLRPTLMDETQRLIETGSRRTDFVMPDLDSFVSHQWTP